VNFSILISINWYMMYICAQAELVKNQPGSGPLALTKTMLLLG
jgi:hypothetical protein